MKTDIKSIKNIDRSHRVDGDLTNQYSFYSLKDGQRDLLSTFKVIEMFLQTCIGFDYVRVLPKDYLSNIFRKCDDKREFDITRMDDDDKNYYRCEFSNKITELNRALYYMLDQYTDIIFSDKGDIDRRAEVKTKRYTITSTDEGNSNLIRSPDITYKIFPSIKEYIERNDLATKALKDVEYLLNELADISKLGIFVDVEENSYMRFTYRIIRKMKANYTAAYPRSIINYSAFEFSAEGYPYNTISKNIYSVSDSPSDIKNKFVLHDLYNKNVDAILRFLNDLSFDDKLCGVPLDRVNFETKVLCNVYGSIIALLSLYAEKTMNDNLLNNSLMSKSFN